MNNYFESNDFIEFEHFSLPILFATEKEISKDLLAKFYLDFSQSPAISCTKYSTDFYQIALFEKHISRVLINFPTVKSINGK